MSSSLYYHSVRPYHTHKIASVCVKSVAPEQDAEVQSQESDDLSGEADNNMPASNDTITEHDVINDVI